MEPTLWALTVDADEWSTVRRRISRAGGCYKRFPRPDGCSAVFTNVDLDLGHQLPADQPRRRRLLWDAFEQSMTARGNISGSEEWAREREHKPRGMHLGIVRGILNDEHLEAVISEVTGEVPIAVAGRRGRRIGWKTASAVDEPTMQRLRRALGLYRRHAAVRARRPCKVRDAKLMRA